MPPLLCAKPEVAFADLVVRIVTFLPVRVDTLEVPHLLHKDEPHVRRFSQLHCRLYLFDYIDARQKFRIRASSGNLVIYNSSRSCLWGEKFCFVSPYPYSGIKALTVGYRFVMCAYGDMRVVDETVILFRILAAMVV